jgi:hypothetical protein
MKAGMLTERPVFELEDRKGLLSYTSPVVALDAVRYLRFRETGIRLVTLVKHGKRLQRYVPRRM